MVGLDLPSRKWAGERGKGVGHHLAQLWDTRLPALRWGPREMGAALTKRSRAGPGPQVVGLSPAADLPAGLPSWLLCESLCWLPGSPLVVRTGGGSCRAGMELRGRGWLPAAERGSGRRLGEGVPAHLGVLRSESLAPGAAAPSPAKTTGSSFSFILSGRGAES